MEDAHGAPPSAPVSPRASARPRNDLSVLPRGANLRRHLSPSVCRKLQPERLGLGGVWLRVPVILGCTRGTLPTPICDAGQLACQPPLSREDRLSSRSSHERQKNPFLVRADLQAGQRRPEEAPFQRGQTLARLSVLTQPPTSLIHRHHVTSGVCNKR